MFTKIATIAATAALFGALAAPAMAAPVAPAQQPVATAHTQLVGVSEHDNVLDIGSSQDVTFTWDGGYSITSGQPWGGVTVDSGTPNGGGVTITAEAGRSGSTEVAQWFAARSSLAVADNQGTDNLPEELNFAFTGTLTINGEEFPVVIGQGHTGVDNNWWIGGQGAGWSDSVFGQTVATSTPVLVTPGGTYAIITELAMNNQLGIGLASDLA